MNAEYLNHYLSDTDVANFARQSFAKLATQFTEEQNNRLIQFLARGMATKDWDNLIHEMLTFSNNTDAHALAVHIRSIPEHWVPFGHPHISLRMSAPVPIARQCFKHKIGFVESEESRRYISTTPELHIPGEFRAAAPSVKQGSAGTHADSEMWKEYYSRIAKASVAMYESMIQAGICPEQARFVLPQGCEVNWVWTGSLYAFANFYNQRSDSHAQKEIQELAEQVGSVIKPLYPVSWAALTEGNY